MGQTDLHSSETSVCPVCAGDCIGFPDQPTRHDYPFLPGGIDPMADQDHVITDRRIDDPELGRAVYGVGDKVPIEDAIKYGLIDPPKPKRAKKGPKADRAKKPGENRDSK